jgi:hypothetical protein
MVQQQEPIQTVVQWQREEDRIEGQEVARVELAVLPAHALASEVFDDSGLMQTGAVVVQVGKGYRLVPTRHLLEKAMCEGDMAMSFSVSEVVGLRMSEVSVRDAQAHGVDLTQPDSVAFRALCERLGTPLLIVPELADVSIRFDQMVGSRPRFHVFIDANFRLARRVFRCSLNPSETYDEAEYRQLGGICPNHLPDGKLS